MRSSWKKRDEAEGVHIPLHMFLHIDIPVKRVDSKDTFLQKLSSYQLSLPESILSFPIYIGWNEGALFIGALWDITPPYTLTPQKHRLGVACEIYIDTKNIRSSRLMHRYCHQFLLFPEAVDGIFSQEITEFRTQESRSLAQNNDVTGSFVALSRQKKIFIAEIPERSLHGWSGEVGEKIGFGITLYSGTGKEEISHSFPGLVGGKDQKKSLLEKFPNSWATLSLLKDREV